MTEASEERSFFMSVEHYRKALKSGEKCYQAHVARGQYPYPPTLEEILPDMSLYATENLGIVQIPSELMIGTSTSGRKTAFAPNFMPLLPLDTEFSAKWISLCRAHEAEGIREPVKVYEYMNHFYVTEGNKRVSVLKFFNDPIIMGVVTRILPPKSDSFENRLYYEFLDFYKLTGINYLSFGRLGDYKLLLERMHMAQDQVWDQEDRLNFRAFYQRFCEAYHGLGGKKLPITAGDAILVYLKIHTDYTTVRDKLPAELRSDLSRLWDDILLRCQSHSVTLLMQPSDPPRRTLLDRLLPGGAPRIKTAFLYGKTPQTSHWTYSHELGRLHLQQTFGDQIATSVYDGLTADTAGAALEKAIAAGNTIIFTTAADFIEPSLLAAINHPQVKILNCSLNCSHRYIRTYYGRMYEAKFLIGAIAGSVCASGRIGYVADYPTYGMIANINAFALGARMVNPRSVIDLRWSTVEGWDRQPFYAANDAVFLSGASESQPGKAPGPFGLYGIQGDTFSDIAMPVWHWGLFYERLIRSTLNSTWKSDDPSGTFKALNYWWGMSAGVIDVVCSRRLPADTEKLIAVLRQAICSGSFSPFSGRLASQDRIIQKNTSACLSPVDIITMDWLGENVRGHIPGLNEIVPSARPLVRLQGVGSHEQQWKAVGQL
jgi:basic membrane lipoprotein Med (substrate-binding protein (PBP1-ABC) superfamily)